MSANSAIFTTTIFGTSSGQTAEEQSAQNTKTQEQYLARTSTNNLKTRVPKIPSNQRYMKD